MKKKLTNWVKNNKILILINLFFIAYIINEGIILSGGEDFRIFIGASLNLLEHKNFYLVDFPLDKNGITLKYAYTPFWTMILIPFSILFSKKILVFLWLILNIILINRMNWIFTSIYKLSHPAKYLLFFTLLNIRYIMHNLDISQMTIFWVYLIIESFYQYVYSQKRILSSSLIALGASIKFMPIVFLYYWLIKKDYMTICLSLIFVAIFTLSPIIFFPKEYIYNQFSLCWGVISPFQSGFNFNLFDNATQSIPSIVAFYSTKFGLHEQIVFVLINCFRLLLLFWIYKIYKLKSNFEYNNVLLCSLCCLGASLIMPYQQHYSFLSAIGLLSIWSYWIVEKTEISTTAYYVFLVSMILYICTSELFIGRHFTSISKDYKLIGIGSLLLILATHIQVNFLSKSPHQT